MELWSVLQALSMLVIDTNVRICCDASCLQVVVLLSRRAVLRS